MEKVINKNLYLSPTLDNKFIVLKSVRIQGVTIPKFYKTNGANIPRILWSLIPPFKPKYLSAVVLHDYLCDLEYYSFADKLFQEELYRVEKSILTRAMVLAVKLYHNLKYDVK